MGRSFDSLQRAYDNMLPEDNEWAMWCEECEGEWIAYNKSDECPTCMFREWGKHMCEACESVEVNLASLMCERCTTENM